MAQIGGADASAGTSADQDPYQTPTANLHDGLGSHPFAIAIGERNTAYYMDFLVEAGNDTWKPSWNWPAFFATSLWLLYRKLWAAWFLYILILPGVLAALGATVGTFAGETGRAVVEIGVALVVSCILVPMYANAIYLRKLRNLVADSARKRDDEQLHWLRRHGGTSWVWVLPLVLFILAILAAIALPAYQSYIEEANAGAAVSSFACQASWCRVMAGYG